MSDTYSNISHAILALQLSNKELTDNIDVGKGKVLLRTLYTSVLGEEYTKLNSDKQSEFGGFVDKASDKIIRLEITGSGIIRHKNNNAQATHGGKIEDYHVMDIKGLEEVAGKGLMVAKSLEGPHKQLARVVNA